MNDFKVGDDVYHIYDNFYGMVMEAFHIEDLLKLKRHTVNPIYVVFIYTGIGKNNRVVCYHDSLIKTSELN